MNFDGNEGLGRLWEAFVNIAGKVFVEGGES